MINGKTVTCLTVVFLSLVSWTAVSFGQGEIDLGFGYNLGVHDNLQSSSDIIDSRAGFVYSLRVFPGSFRESRRLERFGFGVMTQNITTTPIQGENYIWNHRFTALQLAYERLVLRSSMGDMVLGLDFGFAWRSLKNEDSGWNYCDSPFCNLPEFNWLFSPSLRITKPMFDVLSLFGGVRGNLYIDDADTTFPYKSGVMFLIGITYVGPA